MANKYSLLPIPDDSAWDRDKNWWRKIKSYFYHRNQYGVVNQTLTKLLFNPIDNTIEGIKNFWIWKKIIWEDRNWDKSFIFYILEHKLIQQRKELVNANRHYGVDNINSKITLTLNLIDKVNNDFYGMEYTDYEETGEWVFTPTGEKYIDEDTGEEDELSTLDIPVLSERYDEYLAKYPSSLRKIKIGLTSEQLEDKKCLCIMVAIHNENKCNQLLFKVLEKNIHSWWD